MQMPTLSPIQIDLLMRRTRRLVASPYCSYIAQPCTWRGVPRNRATHTCRDGAIRGMRDASANNPTAEIALQKIKEEHVQLPGTGSNATTETSHVVLS